MKLDFSQTFQTLDGETMTRPQGDQAVPATLGYICGTALMAHDPNKPEATDDKVMAWDIATRVYKGGEHDLTAEEIAFVKRKVGENMTAIVVGPALRMLEQR